MTLEHLKRFLEGEQVVFSEKSRSKVEKSRSFLKNLLNGNKSIYGINTGFGKLANVRISQDQLKNLQLNLVRSHAAGVGKELDDELILSAMFLLANSLAKGYSGVRPVVIDTLVEMINSRVIPIVYQYGSLGASGDLAPLAHVAISIVGDGLVKWKGKIVKLEETGIKTLTLEEKEGLALINGTHFTTATTAISILKARQLTKNAIVISALSIEALKGTNKAFHPIISTVRPYDGQKQVASVLWELLSNSEIINSHKDPYKDRRVQDPYSLRCIPQIIGPVIDTINHATKIIETEMNSVTDNPLIFSDINEVISGGNFHAEPIALIAEFLCIALTELANQSEKRTEKMINAAYSNGLPAFLTSSPGLNSGYMIAHYTQAALVNKISSLTMPNTPIKISTSAHQEDHVSMAMNSATKLMEIIELLSTVLAIELICSYQGLEFRHKEGLRSSKLVEMVFDIIKISIPPLNNDRIVHNDIEAAVNVINKNQIVKIIETEKKEEIVNFGSSFST